MITELEPTTGKNHPNVDTLLYTFINFRQELAKGWALSGKKRKTESCDQG